MEQKKPHYNARFGASNAMKRPEVAARSAATTRELMALGRAAKAAQEAAKAGEEK